MHIAFVGCGYAADLYANTLPNHPSLVLAGVYDRDAERLRAFSDFRRVRTYVSLDTLLADPGVDLVVNLTNPASHAEVTRRALTAGKHVYVEKPIALDLDEARQLIELAEARGLGLASAPSTVLGEAAQTVWRALREGLVGTPRLAYAELEAGPVLRRPFRDWRSESGAPWPYLDEFRTGCTIEHAGYYLTWLTTFFGPVTQLTATAAALVPNPHLRAAGELEPADLSIACLSFANGVLARLTTGSVAPWDQSLQIVGDQGVLRVLDGGHFESPVTLTRSPWEAPIHLPLVRAGHGTQGYDHYHHIDFARGIADLADSLAGGRPTRLPILHALHVLELTLAMTNAFGGVTMKPATTFEPIAPATWAE